MIPIATAPRDRCGEDEEMGSRDRCKWTAQDQQNFERFAFRLPLAVSYVECREGGLIMLLESAAGERGVFDVILERRCGSREQVYG